MQARSLSFSLTALQVDDSALDVGSLLRMTARAQKEALDAWAGGDAHRIVALARYTAQMIDRALKIKGESAEKGGLTAVAAVLTDYLAEKYNLDKPNVVLATIETATTDCLTKIPRREIVRPFPAQYLFDLGRRVFGQNRMFFFWGDPFDTRPFYKTAADGRAQEIKQYNNFLIFVEVALVHEIPPTIQHVLDGAEKKVEGKPPKIAIYYSINNNSPYYFSNPDEVADYPFRGLGEKFILEVAATISKLRPEIERHITYSPMPTFRKWIDNKEAFTQSVLDQAFDVCGYRAGLRVEDFRDWLSQASCIADLEKNKQYYEVLRCLGNMYIAGGKFDGKTFKANDGVSRFHVGNGAMVIQVKPGADTSAKGFKESFGFMAHYEYLPDKVADNQRLYENGTIAVTRAVLAEMGRLPRQRAWRMGVNVTRAGVDTAAHWLSRAVGALGGRNGNSGGPPPTAGQPQP